MYGPFEPTIEDAEEALKVYKEKLERWVEEVKLVRFWTDEAALKTLESANSALESSSYVKKALSQATTKIF